MSKKKSSIQEAAKLLGAKGGKVGGSKNTPAQEQARLENLEKARAAREPK
jgi:hypothetical protein